MKIAIITDPEIPVPPVYYGGIERVINLLITGLKKSGHEITLFAHQDSKTSADRFFSYSGTNQSKISLLKNTFLVSKLMFYKPDVVHNFGRLAYLTFLMPFRVPKVMSYQREPTISQVKKAIKFSAKNSMYFTGCSNYITNQIKPFTPASTVYNAVSMDDYQFQKDVSSDAPLVFLGRIEPIKGAHLAIKVAQLSNRKLVIAGNIPPQAQHYFNSEIAPFIGQNISYIGSVNDQKKNELLGSAVALLMPIEWNEPFGIVMAEALACGTPVIAFARGAAVEIVENKMNGYLCNTILEMVNAISKVDQISRKVCRNDAENRFSETALIRNFEEIYFRLTTN